MNIGCGALQIGRPGAWEGEIADEHENRRGDRRSRPLWPLPRGLPQRRGGRASGVRPADGGLVAPYARQGMCLKSTGKSSNLFDPRSKFTLEDFSREKGLGYHRSRLPVKLETFIAYGRAFQQRYVPRVEPKQLVALRAADGGYELCFDDGKPSRRGAPCWRSASCRSKPSPSVFADLPAALASHSSDYGPLDGLEGREVTVVGRGSSALDLAALLSMRGAAVTLVSRSPQVIFYDPPGPDPSPLRKLLSPPSGLGGGWRLRICADAPQLIHLLPDRLRLTLVEQYAWSGGRLFRARPGRGQCNAETWARNRAGGARRPRPHRDRRRGRRARDGRKRPCHRGDRVSCRCSPAWVYRRERFRRIRTVDYTPVLSANFESSAPGLHLIGLASAPSFGPVMRFVVGAVHPARRLARLLPKSLLRRPVSISGPHPQELRDGSGVLIEREVSVCKSRRFRGRRRIVQSREDRSASRAAAGRCDRRSPRRGVRLSPGSGPESSWSRRCSIFLQSAAVRPSGRRRGLCFRRSGRELASLLTLLPAVFLQRLHHPWRPRRGPRA